MGVRNSLLGFGVPLESIAVINISSVISHYKVNKQVFDKISRHEEK